MTRKQGFQPGELCWFDLMTDNLDAAKSFYKALFGWDFISGSPETGNYTSCIQQDAPVAGMGVKPADAPYPSSWTVYFASADINTTAEDVKRLGGQLVMGPMQVFDEGSLLVASDPTEPYLASGKATATREPDW
jgi:predicted enzyme related to lactoylglutathione lyase